MITASLLLTAAILMPAWKDIWDSRPLSLQDVDVPSRMVMHEKDYEMLRPALKRYNSHFRMTVYATLAPVKARANFEFLLKECLPQETDAELKATILNLLNTHWHDELTQEAIGPYMGNSSPIVASTAKKVLESLAAPRKPAAIELPKQLNQLKHADAGTRRKALERLADHDGKVDILLLQEVSALFGDAAALVGDQAEDTFVTLGAHVSTSENVLLPLLDSGNSPVSRRHAVNAMRRLNIPAHQQIARLLSVETLPENLAAVLDALAILAPAKTYAAEIQPFAEHRAAAVRQMAARAMGRLQLEGSQNAVIKLGLDKDALVRVEAFEAMGRFPQPQFVISLINCLTNTRGTTADERRNAGWAAGKQLPAQNDAQRQNIQDLAERLETQVTVAVVPGPTGMLFEEHDVIGNCLISLASLAKHQNNTYVTEIARRVIGYYNIHPDNLQADQSAARSLGLPRGLVTWSIALQQMQWLDGQPITPQPVQDAHVQLPIQEYQSRE